MYTRLPFRWSLFTACSPAPPAAKCWKRSPHGAVKTALACSTLPPSRPLRLWTLGFASPTEPLAVGTAEAFVGHFLAGHPGAAVDYIHGADTVRALARKGGVGLLMPDFAKSDLFKGVVLGGVLPRKTFSMGHAQEKRYYMECRDIDPDFARHAESLSTCL